MSELHHENEENARAKAEEQQNVVKATLEFFELTAEDEFITVGRAITDEVFAQIGDGWSSAADSIGSFVGEDGDSAAEVTAFDLANSGAAPQLGDRAEFYKTELGYDGDALQIAADAEPVGPVASWIGNSSSSIHQSDGRPRTAFWSAAPPYVASSLSDAPPRGVGGRLVRSCPR